MATKTVNATLTIEQYQCVLEHIVGETETLHQLLMLQQDKSRIGDEFAKDVCLDSSVLLARRIGAMAGGAIGGNVNSWNFGPNFDGVGRGVSRG